MYRPYMVTRQERAAFQLVGDKVVQKLRQHKPLENKNERDSYWRTAISEGLNKLSVSTVASA